MHNDTFLIFMAVTLLINCFLILALPFLIQHEPYKTRWKKLTDAINDLAITIIYIFTKK